MAREKANAVTAFNPQLNSNSYPWGLDFLSDYTANFIPFILCAPIDHQIDRPTLIECIRFRGRERRINIPQEIGVKYYQFGLLLLENDTIRSIAHKHREDPERINIEVLEEWVAGRGKHPITWQTLTQILCDIKLCTLAVEIEEVKC